MADALFDLGDFEETAETPVAFVPRCNYCTAAGDPIVIDGEIVRDWRAAAMWAEVAIAAHMREFHREHCSPWMLAGEEQG